MKELSVFINARLQSSRLQNKMTRKFAHTSLLRLALEKLNQMTFAKHRFFCIAEEELAEFIDGLTNIEIIWRKKEAVSKGDTGHLCFEHYSQFPTSWFMFINASHPFVSLDSYRKGYEILQNTDYNSYTSVTKRKVWIFDSKGNPITNTDPKVTSTKEGDYYYLANHAFHIINKDFFIKTGQHWKMQKDSPFLIEIPEHEALDIDSPLDFNNCETLFKNNYPQKYISDKQNQFASVNNDVEVSDSRSGPFSIGPFNLTDSNRTLIIAEVACAHDGNLETAFQFVDASSQAGVDIIKFQTHIADAESTPQEPFRVKISDQDPSRMDYWKRMEFTEDQWLSLKKYAEEKKLLFMSSPFSNEAADLLMRIGVPAWKVGSGEVTNELLLRHIGKKGLPVILSTGMSFWSEIDWAVNILKQMKCPLALLQCSTMYPCPPESAGLNNIKELKERYNVPVGFSSHSSQTTQSLAAVCFGAQIIEFHLTLTEDMPGPDTNSSLTPQKAKQLIQQIREVEIIKNSFTNKDIIAYDLRSLREIFFKSIVAQNDITEGVILNENMLTAKKPGTGISPKNIQSIIGKRTKRAIPADKIISYDDLED